MMNSPISFNNQNLSQNPTSNGPNRPVYKDQFDAVQNSFGSFAKYGLNQFSGSGTTSFNVGSYLPVNQAVYDKGFSYGGSQDTYPIQFNGQRDYDKVTNFLLQRSLPMPQGIPYNLFIRDQGELFQLGSQVFNMLQPVKINETPQPFYGPNIGLNAMPISFGGYGMPDPYGFAQVGAGYPGMGSPFAYAQASAGYPPIMTGMNPYAMQAIGQGFMPY